MGALAIIEKCGMSCDPPPAMFDIRNGSDADQLVRAHIEVRQEREYKGRNLVRPGA